MPTHLLAQILEGGGGITPTLPDLTLPPENAVADAKAKLEIQTTVSDNFTLPTKGENDVNISWQSSDNNLIAINGSAATVTRPTDNDKNAELTATLSKSDKNDTKKFSVMVLADNYREQQFESGDRRTYTL